MAHITINGSQGEGGGQILRSSLALSMITQTPISIHSIRGKRKSPGLKNQHLTSVRAAATVCNGELTGDYLGSGKISFSPSTITAGNYLFDTGTAGSCFLVFQTIFPALMIASEPSHLTIRGGTHNLMAPPAEFVDRSFLGTLRSVGVSTSMLLNRYGYYPQGGGEIEISLDPSRPNFLNLTDLSPIRSIVGETVLIKKQQNIATVQNEELRAIIPSIELTNHSPFAVGPGNSVTVTVNRDEISQVFTGFGKRETPPNITARVVALKAKEYITSGVAVDSHLTDQLMIPLLLGNGGKFTCPKPTLHATTNAEIMRMFTGAEIRFEQISENQWMCEVPSLRSFRDQ